MIVRDSMKLLYILKFIVFNLSIVFINAEILPLSKCNDTVKSLLCHKNDHYLPSEYPEPHPCQVNITMHLKDIYDIDEEKNTISLLIRLSTAWMDDRISLYRDKEDKDEYDFFQNLDAFLLPI